MEFFFLSHAATTSSAAAMGAAVGLGVRSNSRYSLPTVSLEVLSTLNKCESKDWFRAVTPCRSQAEIVDGVTANCSAKSESEKAQ